MRIGRTKYRTKSKGVKMSNARKATSETGVYKQDIISSSGKKIDEVYSIRYSIDGKEKLKTIGRKKRDGVQLRDAKYARDELMSNERAGVDTGYESSIYPLNKLARAYYGQLHTKTSEKYRVAYESNIKPYLGSKNIHTLKPIHIVELQNLLKHRFSPKYVNDMIANIKRMFKFGMVNDIIDKNPAAPVKNLKLNNQRMRVLTPDEISTFLNHGKATAPFKLFMNLSLSTGGRIGAICKLTLNDFNFNVTPVSVRIHNEKADRFYTGFITDPNIVNDIKSIGSANDLLLSMKVRDTPKLITERLRDIFKSIADESMNDDYTATVDRVVPHTLRHTFGSRLGNAGVSPMVIKALMDHNSLQASERYVKINNNAMIEALGMI